MVTKQNRCLMYITVQLLLLQANVIFFSSVATEVSRKVVRLSFLPKMEQIGNPAWQRNCEKSEIQT